MRSFDATAINRLCSNLHEIIEDLKDHYGITVTIKHIEGEQNTHADALSRLKSKLPNLETPSTDTGRFAKKGHLGNIRVVGDNAAVFDMAPNGPSTEGVLYLIPSTNCSTLLATNPSTSELDTIPNLDGIVELSPEDITHRLQDLYSSDELSELQDLKIYGVQITDLLKVFKEPNTHHTPEAEKLIAGGARGQQFAWDNNLLVYIDFYHGNKRIRALLPNKWFQLWAMQYCHDNPLIGGHRGTPRCIEMINKLGFWWPSMNRDIVSFTSSCELCQIGKPVKRLVSPILQRRRPGARFSNIQIDFIGPINDTESSPGHWTYMGVIIDEATSIAMNIPSWDCTTRSAIMCLLMWMNAYGRPDTCQSDNGPAFASEDWSSFLSALNIQARFGTPAVPRHQGAVERLNREIKSAVRIGNAVDDHRRLPWWTSALVAVGVHNSSPLSDYPALTPSELTLGSDHTALLRGIEDPLYQNDGTIEDSKLQDFWHGLLEYISDVYTLFVHLKVERITVDEFEGLLRANKRDMTTYSPGDVIFLVGYTPKGTRKVIGEYKVVSVAPNNRFMYYLDGLNGLYPVSRLIPKSTHPLRSLLDAAAKPQRSALASALGNTGPGCIAFTSLKPGDWFVCEWRNAPRPEGSDEDDIRPFWQYFVCEVSKHQRGVDREKEIRAEGLDYNKKTGRWMKQRSNVRLWQISREDFFVGFKPTTTRRIPATIKKWLDVRGLSVDA